MILGLDLSTSRTGFALISYEGGLVEVSDIVPPSKLTTPQKIYYIVQELKKIYPKVKEVVLESTWQGMNPTSNKVLNWLGGAVMYSIIEFYGVEPLFYGSAQARSIVGIKGTSKADYQLFVLNKFYPKVETDEFITDKKVFNEKYVAKKMTRKQMNNKLKVVSKDIGDKTGMNNDRADAIVIAYAHYLTRSGKCS